MCACGEVAKQRESKRAAIKLFVERLQRHVLGWPRSYWWGKLSLWASSSQMPTCWSIRHEANHLATGQPHTGTIPLELPLADIQVRGGGWGWCRITHWWNQALEHLLVVCLYLQRSLKVMPLLLAQHDEGLIWAWQILAKVWVILAIDKTSWQCLTLEFQVSGPRMTDDGFGRLKRLYLRLFAFYPFSVASSLFWSHTKTHTAT